MGIWNGEATKLCDDSGRTLGYLVSAEEFEACHTARERVRELEEELAFLGKKFEVMRDCYRSLHHRVFEQVKDQFPLDELANLPLEGGGVPFDQVLKEFENGSGG